MIYIQLKLKLVDENIFKNWKLFTEGGDYLTKTTVKSAGNAGDNPQYGFQRGFHSITGESKNIITVGAMNVLANGVADFSSLGPTWDGRIKPDVMAQGDREGLVAATTVGKGVVAGYNHDFMCGTSASAPVVSGIVALMYQKFREKTGLPLEKLSMRNSTTKAMLIHSADDMTGFHYVVDVDSLKSVRYGKGPDFITGWGSVNAKGALDIIGGYDATTQKFERFREFEIYNGMVKKWTFNIPTGAKATKARVTLVWDDAPPSIEEVSVENFTKSKLVNDLDMYIESPSGKRYYPWKLDTLPTYYMDWDGNVDSASGLLTRISGLEKIAFEDAEKGAHRCKKAGVGRFCFDHLNNVEVIDVEGSFENELLETGEWQVVVEGYKVVKGNSTDGFAQVASIVSDFKLEEPACFKDEHPYLRNKSSSCMHPLGDYLENYVTFDSRTYVASGDWIYLYDSADQLIGAYTGWLCPPKVLLGRSSGLKVPIAV